MPNEAIKLKLKTGHHVYVAKSAVKVVYAHRHGGACVDITGRDEDSGLNVEGDADEVARLIWGDRVGEPGAEGCAYCGFAPGEAVVEHEVEGDARGELATIRERVCNMDGVGDPTRRVDMSFGELLELVGDD